MLNRATTCAGNVAAVLSFGPLGVSGPPLQILSRRDLQIFDCDWTHYVGAADRNSRLLAV
jgi:hypothetical protein